MKSSRRAGRVRLITKYDSVYVISVGSVREVWPAYEESLSKSLEHFTILY